MSEKSRNTVVPKIGSGFKDYLSSEMIARNRLISQIRNTFELFGFLPLDTPAIEYRDTLTGGDQNFDKNIYSVYNTRGTENESERERDIFALRFDLTVPLARVVSQYKDKISKPFKRYQFGRVWRG